VQDIVSLDLKSTLKPHVQAMKEKYNQKFHATHREYLKMQLDVTRLEDCVLEKKDEKTSIKTRFDKAQQQYQQEKEVHYRDIILIMRILRLKYFII
tara:strand:+ start:364 stop:651 length:288 start_codon:yes stop_codon:yes gene_type:complete